MPIQTRCPSCSAAVAPGAVWCSLCHADLRPAPEQPAERPDGLDLSLEPASDEPHDDAPVDVPRGRHSAEPAPAAAPSRGRHAASSGLSSRLLRPLVTTAPAPRPAADLLEDLEIPSEPTPEAVDALADQMLLRLSVTEQRPHVIDPRDLPGGPWGFTAALAAAIVAALLLLGTAVGFVLHH